MKKWIAALLVICALFTGGISVSQVKEMKAAASAEKARAAAAEQAEAAAETTASVDYLALYQSHDPDEIVGTCDGRDISWQEYFYYYYGYASDIESYMSTMAMYGMPLSWEDVYDEESGMTYAQLPAAAAPEELRQYETIDGYASGKNIALSEENAALVAEQIDSVRTGYLGEDATEEDLEALLMESYLPLSLYKRLLSSNYLYQQVFTEEYGENGSKIPDDEAVAYLEDNGYIAATHILLLTKDMSTGEDLDEETAAERAELAASLSKELSEIENAEERLARFNELKAEYDEDTGKTAYPDGYTFTSGTMVAEFEDACNALTEFEVSEPVKSSYGYHVIMRLPLDPDAVLEYSSSGTPLSARAELANSAYGEELQNYYDTIEFVSAEGFTAPVITDFIK